MCENATNRLHDQLVEWRKKFEERASSCERLDGDGDIEKLQTLKQLCKLGADLDVVEKKGIRCIPSVFWDPDLVKFFLKQGRDINTQDESGDTALHLAVYYDLNHAVRCLYFDHLADPTVLNVYGETPVFTLIKNKERPWKTMGYMWAQTRLTAVKTLLDSSYINLKNENGETILHFSCKYGNHRLLNYLLETYDLKDIINSQTSKSLYEKTPLMIAARLGNVEQCRMLLDAKADISVQDLQGYTTFHHSVIQNCGDVFMNLRADPCITSKSGRDVYELACLHDNMFLDNAQPSKQIHIYEMAGALVILRRGNYERGEELWKLALETGIKFCIPTEKYLTENPISFHTAMESVYRISTGPSKVWNLLSSLTPSFFDNRRCTDSSLLPNVIEMLNFVNEKMESDNYQDFGSLDEMDLDTLGYLVEMLEEYGDDPASLYPCTQCLAKLAIACMKMWISQTDQNLVSDYCFDTIYYTLSRYLAWIYWTKPEVISQTQQASSFDLLAVIIKLDPRNESEGDSILHEACRKGHIQLIEVILEIGTNVECFRNKIGYNPFQEINPKDFKLTENMDVIEKMLLNGAHLDERNSNGGSILDFISKEKGIITGTCIGALFPHVKLQCLCARILAKRHLLYMGKRLPKTIVDFINKHIT